MATRGVRPYGNRWRANVVDKNGKMLQSYFDDEQSAIDFRQKILDEKEFAKGKVNKRTTASDPTLPVGILPTKFTRKGVVSHGLRTTAMINGKMVAVTRMYGENRTRSEAIALLLVERGKLLERKEREENAAKTDH